MLERTAHGAAALQAPKLPARQSWIDGSWSEPGNLTGHSACLRQTCRVNCFAARGVAPLWQRVDPGAFFQLHRLMLSNVWMGNFFSELRRRKVYRVAIAYAVVS